MILLPVAWCIGNIGGIGASKTSSMPPSFSNADKKKMNFVVFFLSRMLPLEVSNTLGKVMRFVNKLPGEQDEGREEGEERGGDRDWYKEEKDVKIIENIFKT